MAKKKTKLARQDIGLGTQTNREPASSDAAASSDRGDRSLGTQAAKVRRTSNSPAMNLPALNLAALQPAPMQPKHWWALVFSAAASALAFPPFGLWPLAFIAASGWILLARMEPAKNQLKWVWLFGLLHWGVTFHFLRLPHWTGSLGLLLIGGYAAFYDVIFVWVLQRLLARKWPTAIAAPVVWAAIEVLRSTLFTGIPIAILGHALFRQPLLIQTADLAGEITVSFLLVMISAVVANLIALFWIEPKRGNRRSVLISLLIGLNVLAFMLIYGWQQQNHFQLPQSPEVAKVALVQGSRDVQFGLSEDAYRRESTESYQSHRELSISARRASTGLNLIVWPESMFPSLDVMPIEDKVFDLPPEELAKRQISMSQLLELQRILPYQVLHSTGTGSATEDPFRTSVPIVAGMRSYDVLSDSDYNAAVLFDIYGNVDQRYFKTHLVPFGEYLPLGEYFPDLYKLAPIPRGLSKGSGVKTFVAGDRRLVPTICYESVIPWHVRGYIEKLNSENSNVDASSFDALLNISNDGWFWGSSALDLHLASNVFRSVENRCQHLIASNTGISGEIAPNGQILQEAPKRTSQFFVVDVPPRPASWKPLWWTVGNGPWWCAMVAAILWILIPVTRSLPHELADSDLSE